MTENRDVSVYQNEDYADSLTIKINGIAADITGWTIYFTIKKDKADADSSAIYQQVVTSHTSPTTGVTRISIPNSTLLLISAGDYYYDIKLKDSVGTKYTGLYGIFTINGTVTKTWLT